MTLAFPAPEAIPTHGIAAQDGERIKRLSPGRPSRPSLTLNQGSLPSHSPSLAAALLPLLTAPPIYTLLPRALLSLFVLLRVSVGSRVGVCCISPADGRQRALPSVAPPQGLCSKQALLQGRNKSLAGEQPRLPAPFIQPKSQTISLQNSFQL